MPAKGLCIQPILLNILFVIHFDIMFNSHENLVEFGCRSDKWQDADLQLAMQKFLPGQADNQLILLSGVGWGSSLMIVSQKFRRKYYVRK